MTRFRAAASASAALTSGVPLGWNGYATPGTRSVRPTA
jgi:hypothetical protein